MIKPHIWMLNLKKKIQGWGNDSISKVFHEDLSSDPRTHTNAGHNNMSLVPPVMGAESSLGLDG